MIVKNIIQMPYSNVITKWGKSIKTGKHQPYQTKELMEKISFKSDMVQKFSKEKGWLNLAFKLDKPVTCMAIF